MSLFAKIVLLCCINMHNLKYLTLSNIYRECHYRKKNMSVFTFIFYTTVYFFAAGWENINNCKQVTIRSSSYIRELTIRVTLTSYPVIQPCNYIVWNHYLTIINLKCHIQDQPNTRGFKPKTNGQMSRLLSQ